MSLWKLENELWAHQQFVDFSDVQFVVWVVELEAQFQVLVVEYSEVGLWVGMEHLNHSSIVQQICSEELWQLFGVREDVSFIGRLELSKGLSTARDLLCQTHLLE